MRDPFKNRTIQDLAMQYVLMTGPNPPSKMYSVQDLATYMDRTFGAHESTLSIVEAENIIKMVAPDG
jgi:hypothetical protein